MNAIKSGSLVNLFIREGITDPAKAVKKCTSAEMKKLQNVVLLECQNQNLIPVWTKLNHDTFQNGNSTPESRLAISELTKRFLRNDDGRVTIIELVIGMINDAKRFTRINYMENWK